MFLIRYACSEIQRYPIIWQPIAVLQAIGGVVLVIGYFRPNKWVCLPWMFAATLFTYGLLMNSFCYWKTSYIRQPLTCLTVSYILIAVWVYFLYAVFADYLKLRTAQQTAYEIIDGTNDEAT
ncbi:uncharacterized protein LOC115634527 [Scaptodrosophila lebanonensis]|uniref:Uncharacterized protein LOC115634527 n=1 Tax=Drosophila lebanonensis TaxID=7225 RepID=A0A6J2UL68_DROLE|nr:uncharacterized protein LOC115634527 [Scaptodrosophila lebanonensis]